MDSANSEGEQTTVGLDVSDKFVQACFLDHHGIMVSAT